IPNAAIRRRQRRHRIGSRRSQGQSRRPHPRPAGARLAAVLRNLEHVSLLRNRDMLGDLWLGHILDGRPVPFAGTCVMPRARRSQAYWRGGMRLVVAWILLILALAGAPPASCAENPEISVRRAAERKAFTDAEIAEGFFKTVFGAELRLRGRTDVIRKYDGPVRVFMENRARPDRRSELAKVIEDIRAHVDHLDIAITDD